MAANGGKRHAANKHLPTVSSTVDASIQHTAPVAPHVNKRSLIKLCYETAGDKVDNNELGSSFRTKFTLKCVIL